MRKETLVTLSALVPVLLVNVLLPSNVTGAYAMLTIPLEPELASKALQ